ncbi:tRNA lysidine(34) synthetase TilS [Roseomonas sp. M0104]|uniref:tRNA(Ile)-lysidine synthase n=2 Tax=Teichococcus coralli TaxID=2545983 RepID=A0A845BFT4_9PROT|nr:tRNA lysidine(34) synthetase TilS [Pseudoroseomonas coralli]MXP65865.1 tRNA lysidine(34) synthetase TilS [Pseudoroseomonas coralli]
MAPLGPFGQAPRLAVGVSGGPHSLALALLAHDFSLARGGEVQALVVDHGLRPDSAGEAAWTLRTLAAQGIAADRITLALPRGPALQERARTARLAALLEACAARGLPWLLLGQHRMDQAETLLFRALRGSGPAGLAGMAALRPAAEALILRPLLDMPPARLEALLRRRGLEPLRDPSNADPRFTRVRLRTALRDPDGTGAGTAALAAAARAFARRRARLEAKVARRLAGAVALHPEGWAQLDPPSLGKDDVAQAALGALLRLLAGAEHAPAGAAVARLLARGQGTLHGVVWKGDRLCREPAACAPPVPARAGAVWDGRWRLLGQPGGEELRWGALGTAAAGLDRAARRGLPARVLAGLPALWREDCPVGIPCLGLGVAADAVFAPAGGPLSA